ncbi:MAG: response regulator [Oscillatoriales cyanobacterium]|nr:MAG: response regulator [Oscillatoriales cyanobacterium]TAF48058.1 MAG: response regulator [Oscillatoriales cyanobacterium]TAF66574.1 MAG: response regulator [Oscillatoriales cyanobacterium]
MKTGIKILIVDDDEVDRMKVRRSLKSAGVVVEISEAEDCASALEKLSIDQNDIAAARLSKQEQSQKPMEVENTENSVFSNQIFDCKFDCVFLDYRLPDGDALTLVEDIRELGFKVPLIVLTGQGDEQIAVELMKAGASDYIVKCKLSSDSLAHSLYNAIRVYRAESHAFHSSQKLKESEERYRLVLEGVNDGIWDWDLTKNEVYWNDRLLEMIGLGRSQFGHTMEALYTRLHPEDKEDIIQAIEAHLEAEIDYNVQFRLLHSNGAYRYCTSQGKAQRNSQGKAVRMAGMISDITDRKNAEDALERERQQLRQIITCVPVAMAMFDTEMCYLAHSDRWLTQFNLNLPSLSTLSHYNLFPDLPDGWKMLYQQVLKGEIVSRSEDAWERADGSILILRWAAHPWYNSDGAVGGMVMVADKINELVEARETALKASLIKSQFLANMSHEIRTPMNGVLGMAELLVRTPLEPKQRELAQTIYRSAEHLLMVINDILDFSKIEAGEMRLAKENFDLDNCLESVIEMVASLVEEKGIELNIVVESSVPRKLVGDSSRLKQILLNLTGNAIKFTDGGQILIYVNVKRDKQNKDNRQGDKLLFSVRDTGIGISPEGQTKLFQSFSQVDSSAARQYGGTGLGLAICKQLVDRMEGEIGVRSSLGSGSTFWFSIPLEKQWQAEQTHPELVGKKLLVVSGSALMRAAVRAFAQTWGARCDEAETAAAALTWLTSANSRMSPQSEAGENCCDVVFVDLQMPDLEAEEFVVQVRSLSAIGPLIAIASLGEQPKAEALCDRGFSGYLMKPVRASRLLPALLWAVNDRGDFGSTFATNSCDLPVVNSQFFTSTNSPSSLKILLAEDHQINQQVILAQLAVLGYQADCASNGKEALDLLAANSYDLVLMDCQMPILDGYETTQKLREQEKGDRHTFVIALTAHAMPGEREKCLAIGMDDYLSKPVDLAALAAAINTYEVEKTLSKNNFNHKNIDNKNNDNSTTIFTNPLPKQLVSAVSPEQQIAIQTWEHGDCDGLFDKQRLEQLGRVNIKLPQRILQSFVENVKVDLESAQNAVLAKDWQVVEYQAHRIKGSSANVGVTLMSDLAAQLELHARSFQSQQPNVKWEKNDGIDNILGSLSNYLLRVQQFIESIMLKGDEI